MLKFFFTLALLGSLGSLLSADDELAYRSTRRGYDRYDDYRDRQNRAMEERYRDRYRYNYMEGPGYYNPYYYTPYYPYGLPGSDPGEFDDIYEQNVNR